MDWRIIEQRENNEGDVPNPDQFIGDQSRILRWGNEIEPNQYVAPPDFLKRNRLQVFESNKFLSMGNIHNPATIELLRCRRNNYIDLVRARLTGLAEETALLNIADIQTTRSVDGFNAKLMHTSIKRWEDNEKPEEKKGFLSRFMRREEKEQEKGEAMY